MEKCQFCKKVSEECVCKEKQQWNNMIDSSVFLGAYDESDYSGDCKVLIDGPRKKQYYGTVTTLILGEIMKQLITLKRESPYRFESIFKELSEILGEFEVYYICEGTLNNRKAIIPRHPKESHDITNLSCAIKNKCTLFIMLDSSFSYLPKKGETEVVQLTNRSHPRFRKLLEKLNIL